MRESTDGTRTARAYGEVWLVRDAPSEADALTAAGLPAWNQEMVPGSIYRVSSRYPQSKGGPTTWEVSIEYTVPLSGTHPTPSDDEDPLNRPAIIEWGESVEQIDTAYDAYGDPKRNSAGDFFTNTKPKTVNVETLRITRFETFYDRDKARRFRNKVNSNPFPVGTTVLRPRECLCLSVKPAVAYEFAAPYLQMEYRFAINSDVREEESTDSGYPFDEHVGDRGLFGWWGSGDNKRKGRFCQQNKNDDGTDAAGVTFAEEPIQLNGKGQPADPIWKVASKPDPTTATPQEPAESAAENHMAEEMESPFSKAGAKQWLFYQYREEDFSGLGL